MRDSNYHAQTKRCRADAYASRMSRAEQGGGGGGGGGDWTLNLENLGTVLL